MSDLVSAWQPITASLGALSAQYNKPVIFAEIGYCANNGCNVNPAGCNSKNARMSLLRYITVHDGMPFMFETIPEEARAVAPQWFDLSRPNM